MYMLAQQVRYSQQFLLIRAASNLSLSWAFTDCTYICSILYKMSQLHRIFILLTFIPTGCKTEKVSGTKLYEYITLLGLLSSIHLFVCHLLTVLQIIFSVKCLGFLIWNIYCENYETYQGLQCCTSLRGFVWHILYIPGSKSNK